MASCGLDNDAEKESLDLNRMEAVRDGDEAAFEALVREHQKRVVAFVYRMLNDAGAAEDIAQQVFVQVWRSARRYRPTAKFTTWLLQIARNLVLNELRRRSRKPTSALVPKDHEASSAIYEDATLRNPGQEALDRELEDAVNQAVAALPEQQRAALLLLRHEDMSYEEIAKVLKTTVPSVKSLIFRARTELRVRLAKYLEE